MRLKPPTAKKSKRPVVVDAEPLESDEDDSSEQDSALEIDFDPAAMAADIAKLLKYSTFEPDQKYWLDTGSRDLNAALGSESRGLPYGKLYEIAGAEHGGKTTLATWLAGLAQQEGAGIGRIDLERSLDEIWDAQMGLDSRHVYNIYPKLVRKKVQLVKTGTSKKKTKIASDIPVLQSAEELFTETEMAIAKMADMGFKKQLWFLDSVANIETEMELAAGNTNWDMRVGYDRAIFLSRVLKKWAGIAANYNAMILFLNQLRFKGGVVFGDPYDTPGGKALRHLCSIRARMRRCKGGEIKRGNRVIGLVSIVKNIKNKAGGGSVQSCEAGIRFLWRKSPAQVEIMSKEDAEGMFS